MVGRSRTGTAPATWRLYVNAMQALWRRAVSAAASSQQFCPSVLSGRIGGRVRPSALRGFSSVVFITCVA